MPGEWSFQFNYDKKESLDLPKYQEALLKIREEFEPKFAEMSPTEGHAEWTSTPPPTEDQSQAQTSASDDNIFVKCVKTHIPKGAGHGTWTLLWDPKKAPVKNHLHARCAPKLFKELSNAIQTELVTQFPANFTQKWANGLTGYGIGGGSHHINPAYSDDSDVSDETDEINRMVRQMLIADMWEDSERCLHHLPWGWCEDCNDDLLDMHGYN